MIRRTLATDSDIFAASFAGIDRHGQQGFDRFIALIKQVRDFARITVQAQSQLSQGV